MIATVTAIALCGVLIFLLGRMIGKLQQEAATRQRIKSTGFFMLDDGFYKAVKVGMDTSKPRPIVAPETLLQTENATPITFRQPESVETPEVFDVDTPPDFDEPHDTPPEPIKKTIKRRNVMVKAH